MLLAIVAAGIVVLRPGDGVAVTGAEASAATAYRAPVLGNPDAPVTITEYGDFQCPSCGAFARSTEPELVKRYIDTGKAKLVFKHFAWIGAESKRAAEAASCAGAQGRFWEFHDYLYTHQRGENGGAFGGANLKGFAGALGLDRAAFDRCLDAGTYAAAVDRDFAEARSLNLTGTPTFVINGTRVVGAQPASVFISLVDQKLAGR